MRLSLCYVTLSVSDLEAAVAFYEGVLGLTVAIHYPPTRWVAFAMDGASGFAVIEGKGEVARPTTDMVDFFADDVEARWHAVRDKCPVVSPLAHTPWGSYKFVIADPDGNRLGFVQV